MTSPNKDSFGNPIDPMLGYAQGQILSDSLAHIRRRKHALGSLTQRLTAKGWSSIFNFTGHSRGFALEEAGLSAREAEEWIGQSTFERELIDRARQHFGGGGDTSAAAFNRSSACIIATALALVPPGGALISIAPGRRSHPSIRQAARLSGARIVEVDPSDPTDWAELKDAPLVMLTRVTSEIDVVPEPTVAAIIGTAQQAGKIVFIDDAYGAQLAPVVLGQKRALALGADLVVTSCDKAGLAGPRGGLLGGREALVDRILGKGSEVGLEARAPVALGILAALRVFDETEIRSDCGMADELYDSLTKRLGKQPLVRSVMGPTIPEEQALRLVLERSGRSRSQLVPCEVTCIIAMHLMHEHGFLTSNVAERPGARVSLRLRTVAKDIARFGGADSVAVAVDEAVSFASKYVDDLDGAKKIILGAA